MALLALLEMDLHIKNNLFPLLFIIINDIKGTFLEFQMYQSLANLFSKLSESTLYKEKQVIFSKKYRVISIRLAILRGIP